MAEITETATTIVAMAMDPTSSDLRTSSRARAAVARTSQEQGSANNVAQAWLQRSAPSALRY